jgi:hypothetical protein
MEVKNPKGVRHGVKEVWMDGERVAGNKILPPLNKEVGVRVILG